MKYSEKDLDNLEKDENKITMAALLLMLTNLKSSKKDLEKELIAFYAKYGKNGVVKYSDARKFIIDKERQRRLTYLLSIIELIFSDLFDSIEPQFRKMLVNIIEKETDFFDVSIEVNDLSWGADDSTWETRLNKDIKLWESYTSSDIKRAFLTQKPIDSVLKQIDKRFLTMASVLTRLCLTESTATSSISKKKIFKELDIKKYQFYSREDERTCEYCGALHGKIFPMSAYEVGVTASPIHAHCRCWEVPITD